MRNPFKTATKPLTEADSARLRRLEGQVNDLTADLDQILGHVERINARLRQRASRAGASAGEREGVAGDDPAGDNERVLGDQSGSAPLAESQPRKMSRQELMARARTTWGQPRAAKG